MHPRRALTARGICMLALGAAALTFGSLVGQRELVGLGVLLVALPALSALSLSGSIGRITHHRSLSPERVPAGHDARVGVRIGNMSATWPVSSVSVQDTLPTLLGHEPRYGIGFLRPGATRDVSYLVRPAVRGVYPIGPLWVSVSDPLGCVRVSRLLGAPAPLLVTPVALPLTRAGTSDSPRGEEPPRRPVGGIGEQDPIPREYRHGDEMRRVHWRSTARHGELMVRREEQDRRDLGAVLLDTRASAHRGRGADHSLETAVAVAASVAVHLLGSSHELHLHTDRARMDASGTDAVLDDLALLTPSGGTSLLPGIAGLRAAPGSPALTVAVLGALSAEEATELARTGRGRRLALLCSEAAWAAPGALAGAADILSSGGWQVAALASPTELPPLWHGAVLSHSFGKGPR
ncbi:DUF58 domain-containing protein [Nocardiopsis algeriensis]|uniref:Uncharacterized protein (DUF58 family) n=1 Tax=Nocardiopsis algeriensis TaxID=1478215 RepID=A0A841IZ84_9ACTN|nr:DUF58 domain-containing protein [Nocardiopsis algeriensis]MBB6121451.1 uncharacterized protein (DUF58 family) [Nocardiopsis algeriensis]